MLYISNMRWVILKLKLLILGVISLGIVVGMFLQIISLFQINEQLSAMFLIIGLISFIGFILIISRNFLSDLKQGIFFDDERTKKVKLYASGRAYFYSLYIWMALLAFQKYFDKDDILILGLFGMALTLLISWLFTKNKKSL